MRRGRLGPWASSLLWGACHFKGAARKCEGSVIHRIPREGFAEGCSHGCLSQLGDHKHSFWLSWVRRSLSSNVYPLERFAHFIHYFSNPVFKKFILELGLLPNLKEARGERRGP